MSLINQMLKDLESRRTPDEATRGVLDGIGNPQPNPARRGLLIGLLATVIILAAVMGYLLLRSNPATNSSPGLAANTNEQTTAVNKPGSSGAEQTPAAEPAQPPRKAVLVQKNHTTPPETNKSTTPAGITRPDETRQGTAETDNQNRDKGDEAQRITERNEPERMEKRVRPLRPSQVAEKLYQEGYALLQRGEQEQAADRWLKALAADPAHTSSREALAALYYSQARRVEAAEQLKQGLDYHPGNTQLALLAARLKIENGDMAGAITVMERALEERQQDAQFYAFLAATYQRDGDYRKSIGAYRQALSRQPGQGIWWMGIAISLENANMKSEALAAYNEALDSGVLAPKLRTYVEGRVAALQ